MAMTYAPNGEILNFDLCDKKGKSKTRYLCNVSLLDVPMIKIWEDPAISSGVIPHFVFSV